MQIMESGLGKKLMIIPWFGPYPEWLNQWVANMEYLKPMGYDYLIFSSLPLFKQRIRDRLGINPNIEPRTGKAWDYRPAFGVLFEEEIKGYEFWGHTDFDCVYGDVSKFEPNLGGLDIWSNHYCYVCGPWTLYRNCEKINNLFRLCDDWREKMSSKTASGWIEMGYSRMVDEQHEDGAIVRAYTHFQSKDPGIDEDIIFENGKLFEDGKECMMFHFNRQKRMPPRIQKYDI